MAEDTAPDLAEAGWVEVHRGTHHDRWLELALVLTALGIDHWLERDAHAYLLLVPAAQADRAGLELAEYEAEADAPAPAPEALGLGDGSGFMPGYVCVLVSLHLFERYRVFGLDWWDAGSAQARRIVDGGEWWRTVTALTLHADASHLFNNLVFGTLFGVLLAQEIGVGWAWLAFLLSGALGNGLNAALQMPAHTSIGASTGVFGAVGLLMGLQRRGPGPRKRSRLRRWAPPIAGAVFLGLLGTSGVRTDVLAHVSGVVVGLPLGWLAGRAAGRAPPSERAQGAPAAAALLLLTAAWWLALRG